MGEPREYATGIAHLALTESGLQIETYRCSKRASYLLDTETGEVKAFQADVSKYGLDETLIYNDLILEKQGYGLPDAITARNRNDGTLIWQFDQEPVVSNIAIGGPITYFLTENVKLMALDTQTGAVLGILHFGPRFPPDFDFVNTSLLVAADQDIVAVYFEDSRQLSIFQFSRPE